MDNKELKLYSSGAAFSEDRKYRYMLWRFWDPSCEKVVFIGLNPSTANESTDDPTIRKVIKFAKDWGYGGVIMMNLFGYVTAYPSELKECSDPIGDNDLYLACIGLAFRDIIFAWGNFNEAKERGELISKRLPKAKALLINKNGSPRHPLYVPGNTVPVPFHKTEVSDLIPLTIENLNKSINDRAIDFIRLYFNSAGGPIVHNQCYFTVEPNLA